MKFGSLMKKELSELLTPQTIFSMIFSCLIFVFMGQVMGKAMEEGMNTSEVTVCDMDNTDYTNDMMKTLAEYGSEPKMVTLESDDYAAELERLDIKSLIIIPEGFTDSVLVENKPADVKFVSKLAMGFSGSMSSISASDAVQAIRNATTDDVLLKTYGLTEEEIAMVKEPVTTVEFTTFSGKTAQVSGAAISSVMMMQSMIAPFVIFFLLLMASQMIMTAIATEKTDKTLETLLSAPVSRMTVLSAKMLSALVVALMSAGFMMVGFISYITGMSGNMEEMVTEESAQAAASIQGTLDLSAGMEALGLTVGAGGYVIFGIQLFLTIAIGLSLSLILGALINDVKEVQTTLTPIMILVMVPFFATMFFDLSTMSTGIRTIMYIIPFTHSYSTLTNLMSGNMTAVIGGMIYQAVFLVVCMFIAIKLFTTDRIFTMTNFLANRGKKKTAAK